MTISDSKEHKTGGGAIVCINGHFKVVTPHGTGLTEWNPPGLFRFKQDFFLHLRDKDLEGPLLFQDKTNVLDFATSNNQSSTKVVTNWLYRSNPHKPTKSDRNSSLHIKNEIIRAFTNNNISIIPTKQVSSYLSK
ncbi:hypothetical protein Smp_174720 [Schistosoma mansoni]|uniref:hypothetical protein n=1 Tax=Schistosoma mansoni TaxID=6183 RepID=UPI0001A61FEB|nr:hypothetical protein Smp_174720 [Schistosoma mansoni]|eukprot:XP_018652846.1 hypothetical protein Smp_174720 [Schistosoma mansoni]